MAGWNRAKATVNNVRAIRIYSSREIGQSRTGNQSIWQANSMRRWDSQQRVGFGAAPGLESVGRKGRKERCCELDKRATARFTTAGRYFFMNFAQARWVLFPG